MVRSKIAPHAMLCTVVLTTAASACGGSARGPVASVRDSAGIQIVESSAPQWAEGDGWTLSAQPILEIGVMDGDDPYMFDGIMGVVRLEDGTLVVGNMGDGTVRYYDSTGTHLHSAGGQGEGPAEFSQIMGLHRFGTDVVAHQFGRLPSKVFDRRGNFVRAMQLPTMSFTSTVAGMFDDGSVLMVSWPQGRTVRGDIYVDSAPFFVSNPDLATSDTIALLPATHFVALDLAGARRGTPQQYGPRLAFTLSGAEWYFGWSENYDIRRLDKNGALQRIVRRTWEPIPVTSADVQRHRDEMMNLGMEGGGKVPPRLQAQRQAIVDGMVYPEHHPAFERIDIDRAGNLWVERPDPANPKASAFTRVRDASTVWDVFDPDGVWLGAVELPGRFWVWEFGDGYVAGVWKDDVDVERVRVYEIAKPR